MSNEENVLSFEEQKRKLKEQLDSGEIDAALKVFDEDKQLNEMNKKHAFINSYGGKPMVMCHVYSNVDNKEIIEFRSPDSIITQYSNQTVQVGKSVIDLGRWWIKHQARREYDTVIFDPALPREYNNCYNVYQGLNVAPFKGSWRYTLRHIYKVLCNCDKEKFLYTIKWFAWTLQNPGIPAEVVIILKGKQGAGKGFIFAQFVEIFGDHGLHISNRNHLTGNFNAHLANCVFLFADEAYFPGDKEIVGAINQLVTEKKLATERKRMDVVKTKNCLHIGMATNEEWVIPAGEDTRRYFINKVDDEYAFNNKTPTEREEYFNNLWGEMANGGREAMVNDLLHVNLKDWHPRFSIPKTEEFKRQAMLSLSGYSKIVSSFLEAGIFPGDGEEAKNYTCTVKGIDEFFKNNIGKIDRFSVKTRAEMFKKIGAKRLHNREGSLWKFPPLPECKELFIKNVSKVYVFDDVDSEWSIGTGAF